MVVGRRAKPTALFQVGYPVTVTTDGEQFTGKVRKFLSDNRVKVSVPGGGFVKVAATQLEAKVCETEGCGRLCHYILNRCDVCCGLNTVVDAEAELVEDPETKGGKEMGFTTYSIIWKQAKPGKKPRFFTVKLPEHELECYGWWRKTRNRSDDRIFYSIDLFAKYHGHSYTIEPIHYTENPLKRLPTLESDICMAINKFLHRNINGKAESIDSLQAKARFPILKAKTLRTIDSWIIELKNIRDTAIRAGGLRLLEMRGDNADSPTVRLYVDLSAQALALEGKVPSLEAGAMFDKAAKGERHAPKLKVTANSSSVQDLLKELKKAKAENNVALARKIRATLRRIGHKGGTRSLTNPKES